MKFGALFNTLAKRHGLNPLDPQYAELLSIQTEISDDAAAKFNSFFATFEEAKNNFDLKTSFKSDALDGVDHRLNTLMDKLGLSDEDKAPLVALRDTYKKIELLPTVLESLIEKRSSATGKKKDDLTIEINRLQEEKATLLKTHSDELRQRDEKFNSEVTNLAMRQMLSSKKTIYDHLPPTAKLAALEAVIKEGFAAKEVQIVRNGDALSPKQVKDPSLDWYDKKTNEKFSVDQLVDSILAENKILDVNGADIGTGNNGNVSGNNYQPLVITGGNGNANQELVNAFAESQKQLNDALKY